MSPSTFDYLEKMRMLMDKEPDWHNPEIIDRVWSKDDFKPKYLGTWGDYIDAKRELHRLDSYDRLKDMYSMLATDKTIIDGTKMASDAIKSIAKSATSNKKENINMPTTNHEYYRNLLEEAGLQCVSADYTRNIGTCGTEVTIRAFIPDEIRLNTNKKEYNTMYNNHKPKSNSHCTYVEPTGIIRRDDTTRVDWEDGTHTVLVRNENSPELDMFYTFCIAFTKKVMGSTGAIMKTIREHDTDAIEKARKEAIAKANKDAEEEAKKCEEERKKAEFEAMVREEMLCHEVREEAIRRLMAKERKEEAKTNRVIDKFLEE